MTYAGHCGGIYGAREAAETDVVVLLEVCEVEVRGLEEPRVDGVSRSKRDLIGSYFGFDNFSLDASFPPPHGTF